MRNFIFFSLLILVINGCVSSTNPHKNTTPIKKNPNVLNEKSAPNLASIYYYSMAETAIQVGDLSIAIEFLLKAEKLDKDNLLIKERILEILFGLAVKNEEYLKMGITFGKRFYEENKITDKIIFIYCSLLLQADENKELNLLVTEYLSEERTYDQCKMLYQFYYSLNPEIIDKLNQLSYEKCEDREEKISLVNLISILDPDVAIILMEELYYEEFSYELLQNLIRFHEQKKNIYTQISLIESGLVRAKLPDDLKSYFTAICVLSNKNDKLLKNLDLLLDSENYENMHFLLLALSDIADLETLELIYKKAESLDPEQAKEKSLNILLEKYFTQNEELKLVSGLKTAFENDSFSDALYSLLSNRFIIVDSIVVKETEESERLINLVSHLKGYQKFSSIDENIILLEIAALHYFQERVDILKNDLEKISPQHFSKKQFAKYLGLNMEVNEEQFCLQLLDKWSGEEIVEFAILGDCYLTRNEYEKSLENYKLYYQGSDDVEENYLLLMNYLNSKLDDPDMEFSIEILEKLRTINGEDFYYLNRYGYLLVLQNQQLDLAEELLLKAIEIEPNSNNIKDSVAWLYYKMGKMEIAKERIDSIPVDEIENSVIAYHFGEIYFKLGYLEKADDFFLMAIELNNDEEAIQIAKQNIEKIERIRMEK